MCFFFFFQAEDGIRDVAVTGVQTCALPISPFEPKKYRDEYQERQRALIAAKLQGQEVATAPQPQLAPVIDLMEALKKSLAEKQATLKKPPARAVPAPAQKKVGRKSFG